MTKIITVVLLLIYAAMMYRKVAKDEAQVEKEDETERNDMSDNSKEITCISASKIDSEIRYILNRLNAALSVLCPPRRILTEVEETRDAVKRLQAMIRERNMEAGR